MKLFSRVLWLTVCLAVFVSIAIGLARFGWEREYDEVAITVSLGDLWKIPQTDPDLVLEAFQRYGLLLLAVSAQEVKELQEQFFLPHAADATILGQELTRLRERGFMFFWQLDVPIPPEIFPSFLKALFAMQPLGLILRQPFSLSSQHVRTLLSFLQEHPSPVGLVEFETPLGIEQLYHQGYRDFYRVHTLKLREREALSEREAVDRYLRAVWERNVRLLELRALTPEQMIADYATLQDELRRTRFHLALPSSPARFALSLWELAALWLGLMGLFILFLVRVSGLSFGWLFLLWVVGVIAGLVGFWEWRQWAQQGAAWLTAVVVPLVAFALLSERRPLFPQSGLVFLLAFSLVSVVGGLGAAAFVSTEEYFLQIQEFPGVKAALILPVVFTALLSLSKVEWRRFQMRDAAVWAAVGVFLVLVLLRSGNFSFWAPSNLELAVRQWLEEFFIVRPRFKEFFIGHPLLMFWGGLGVLRWRPWALAVLLAGLVGQVSIVNSFEHLHTPLEVTLLRSFHGLGIGLALGWLLQMLLRRGLRLAPQCPVD